MKKLYKFRWDFSREGKIESLFIADDETVNETLGKEIYFGEVLGKHSDISGELERMDLDIMTEDQELISTLEKLFDSTDIIGYNPLNYVYETGDEEEHEDNQLELDLDNLKGG